MASNYFVMLFLVYDLFIFNIAEWLAKVMQNLGIIPRINVKSLI